MIEIQDFCKQILEHSGVEFVESEVEETDSEVLVKLTIPTEDVGLFVGKYGETLQALQRIARIVFSHQNGEKRLVVDINEYRSNRMDSVREMATTAAEKVLQTSHPTTITTYLSSAERFVVHSLIGETEEYAQLESFSIGEGRSRRVVIQLKESSENK